MSDDERYPEHAKLSAVQNEVNAVREFLETVTTDGGATVCRMGDSGYRTGGGVVVEAWIPADWRAIVWEHFGIDELALERERRAMLEALTTGGPR